MFKKILAFPGYRSPVGDGEDGGDGDRGDDLTPDQKAAPEPTGKAAILTEEEKAALPGAKAKADAGGAAAADAGGAAAGDADGEEEETGLTDEEKQNLKVPKARLDAALAKGRAREAELRAQIEALTRTSSTDAATKSVAEIETDIEALEAKHKQALDDGKSEVATSLLREIRIRERQIADLRSEGLSERARALAVEQVRVDLLIARLEDQFPQINPDSDEYDQDAVDEVLFLRQSFEAKGLPSSEALSRAMKYVFASAPAKPADAPEKKGLAATGPASNRKPAAVAKAVDAAKRTPAAVDVVGLDSDKKGGGLEGNVAEMTEEEFEALPESTKARLRGDTA